MQEKKGLFAPATTRYINMVCLIVAIGFVLFFPVRKFIWYDESVSVLCSKGLYYTDGNSLTTLTSNTSANLEQYNTAAAAYKCTIIDNGNSFLYNELLHFFTAVSGNSLSAYVWLSRLCGAGVLICVFFFMRMLVGDTVFTSLGIVLLVFDGVFWNMAHQVRAYELGMMLMMLTGIFFWKYLFDADRAIYLLVTGLLAAATILTHYLSAYAVLVMVAVIVLYKRLQLFKVQQILAILLPVAILGVYFWLAASGFSTMNSQNNSITARRATEGFSAAHVLLLSIKYATYNFKLMFPAFKGSDAIVVLSFLLLIGLYIFSVLSSRTIQQKNNLHILFGLGISSCFFLAALCLKSHHYTALYFRYHSFSVPFAVIFTVYCIYIISQSQKISVILKAGITLLIVVPTALYFFVNIKEKDTLKFNHMDVAKKIVTDGVNKITVPNWTDAFLIQSFLPKGYNLEYSLDITSQDFVLDSRKGIEKVKVIRINT